MLLCEMFTGLRDSTVTNRTDVIRLRIRTTISGLPVAVFLWPASQSTQTNFLNTWTALFWVISRRVTVREITATCCVTTQKTAVLSYFAAEAANHTNFLYTFIYLSSTAANKVSWIRCEGQNFFSQTAATLKMKAPRSFETPGTTHAATPVRTTQVLNHQQTRCQKYKPSILTKASKKHRKFALPCVTKAHVVLSGVPRNFVRWGGSINSFEDRGQR